MPDEAQLKEVRVSGWESDILSKGRFVLSFWRHFVRRGD